MLRACVDVGGYMHTNVCIVYIYIYMDSIDIHQLIGMKIYIYTYVLKKKGEE